MLAQALAAGMGVERRPEPRPFVSPTPYRRRRWRDQVRVVRVAGPAGFRWHVKRDGLTVSSHDTTGEAERAATALRGAR